MTNLRLAEPTAPATAKKSRIGLNLAGGGPLGGMYEIGALCALKESLDGIDFNELDVYVGVSVGSLIAASLANGITPESLYRIMIGHRAAEYSFQPESFLRPAFREYSQRAKSVPKLVMEAFITFLANPGNISLKGAFATLGRAIPTGVFDGDQIAYMLEQVFSAVGRSNDFRDLNKKLYVIATDLDSGRSVKFGGKGRDHVPISRAVEASCALPGLYPPVEIDGEFFVDGALVKTLHASVSLDEGADFVLCLNPIVPYDAKLYPKIGVVQHEKLKNGGLPVVLSQTFRAIIHSRMKVGLSKYSSQYKHADVVLFEPSHADAEMFFANVFSYAERNKIAEHAYQRTRQELLNRADELQPIFEKHGIRMRMEVLRDRERHLAAGVKEALRDIDDKRSKTPLQRLDETLEDLERWIKAETGSQKHAA